MSRPTAPATGLAAAPRGGVVLAKLVRRGLEDVASYDRAAGTKVPDSPAKEADPGAKVREKLAEDIPPRKKNSCGCETPGGDARVASGAFFSALGASIAIARRRRSRARRAPSRPTRDS
jgi:hypothetical protein